MDLHLSSPEQELILSLVRVLRQSFRPKTISSFESLQVRFRERQEQVQTILDLLTSLWGKLSLLDDPSAGKKKAFLKYFSSFYAHFYIPVLSCSSFEDFGALLRRRSLPQMHRYLEEVHTEFSYAFDIVDLAHPPSVFRNAPRSMLSFLLLELLISFFP